MKVFFTSDTHFGHANIIRYSNRPFADVNEMNEAIIERWNKVVTPDDVVYHLGDFALSNVNSINGIIHRLNFSHLHFIKGNHDKSFCQWYRDYTGGKVTLYNSYIETVISGITFTLCHYAMATWNKKHHGALMLCGHSHYNLPATRKQHEEIGKILDVGVDGNDFIPYSLEEVVRIMEKKPLKATLWALNDHHGK